MGLVPWAEVEDLPLAPVEAAPAAEDLPAGEPADKDQRVGLGDVEELAVHLLFFKLDGLADSLDDGMSRRDHPEPLPFARLSPLERARGAHQPLEDLGVVPRVE